MGGRQSWGAAAVQPEEGRRGAIELLNQLLWGAAAGKMALLEILILTFSWAYSRTSNVICSSDLVKLFCKTGGV